MRRLNLSQRLFLITMVALLPTIVVLGFNVLSLRRAQEREIHAAALRVAELVALEMDQILVGAENLLRAIAYAPVVNGPDAESCEAYLSRLVEQLPQYVSIAVIDEPA